MTLTMRGLMLCYPDSWVFEILAYNIMPGVA